MLKECRNDAGINILDAAEALGVAERTLRGYEAADNAPPDIIDRMARYYNKPILRYWYCGNCVIGREIHPEVSELDLQAAALRLKNAVRGIESHCTDLLVIADDGVIDENEKSQTEKILERLDTVRVRVTEFLVNAGMWLKEENGPAAKQMSR